MSLQTGLRQHSFPVDLSTLLEDGAAAITADGAGSEELDFGGVSPGPAVTQIAYTKGTFVVDVSAFEFGDSDEEVRITVQLGTVSGFGSGVIANKVTLPMGLVGGIAGSGADNDTAVGRMTVDVDNEHKGTVYRFMRLWVDVGGTTASITFTAWLVPQSA